MFSHATKSLPYISDVLAKPLRIEFAFHNGHIFTNDVLKQCSIWFSGTVVLIEICVWFEVITNCCIK